MKINLKKISAIATSALMVGMTMGVAAAANYPGPFLSGGVANVAIVYGTGSGVSILDGVQAGNIQYDLSSRMTGAGTSSSAGNGISVTGEAADLSNGNGVYFNDTILTSGKSILTKYNLPNLLADATFSGNVQATGTQTINIGGTPTVTFAQPTSQSDGMILLSGSTSTANQFYNDTVTFNQPVNFTSSSSIGGQITLFGQKYTVSPASSISNLVLLQSSQQIPLKVDMSSGSAVNTAQTTQVTFGGVQYTITLQYASGTGNSGTATILVTDANGGSGTSTISAGSSQTIDGLQVGVISASSGGNIEQANIVVGSNQLTFPTTGQVTYGASGTGIQGTSVVMNGNPGNLTSLTVEIAGPNVNNETVYPGMSFIDPVFQSFQLVSPGFNSGLSNSSTTGREKIIVEPNGPNNVAVDFTNYNGVEKVINFADNLSSAASTITLADASGRNMSVSSNQPLRVNEYAMVGNENTANLIQIQNIGNSTTTYTVTASDVFSGTQYTYSSSSPTGVITIGSNQYAVTIQGPSTSSGGSGMNLSLTPSAAGNNVYLYPAMQTMGNNPAQVMFYKPVTINLTNPTGLPDAISANVSGFYLPNGASGSFAKITVASNYSVASENWTINSIPINTSQAYANVTFNEGPFTYTAVVPSPAPNGTVTIYVDKPGTTFNQSGNLSLPGVLVIENKDDKGNYNGWAVSTTVTSGDLISYQATDTWDNLTSGITRQSNTKLSDKVDRYGMVTTTDTTASPEQTITLNYPYNSQLAEYLYIANNNANIAQGATQGGVASTPLGNILVKDSQVSSVTSTNLVVVGGSCINSVAANLLGSAACGNDFTTATNVGSGQFLIQSFADPFATGKVALLVAGYDAADTVNAAQYLTTQPVNTVVGTKYIGTSATTATLQTSQTTTH